MTQGFNELAQAVRNIGIAATLAGQSRSDKTVEAVRDAGRALIAIVDHLAATFVAPTPVAGVLMSGALADYRTAGSIAVSASFDGIDDVAFDLAASRATDAFVKAADEITR